MHRIRKSTAQLLALFVGIVTILGLSAIVTEASPVQVAEAAICLDVVDLQCQGENTTFSSSLGKLYCFTRIIGAQEPTEIFHVWYYKEKERARVALQVNSPNWRTYSSKIIQLHETGEWRVEILGPNNELLRVVHFQVVP